MKKLLFLVICPTLFSLALPKQASASRQPCQAVYLIGSTKYAPINLGSIRGRPKKKDRICRDKAINFLNQDGAYRIFGMSRRYACEFIATQGAFTVHITSHRGGQVRWNVPGLDGNSTYTKVRSNLGSRCN